MHEKQADVDDRVDIDYLAAWEILLAYERSPAAAGAHARLEPAAAIQAATATLSGLLSVLYARSPITFRAVLKQMIEGSDLSPMQKKDVAYLLEKLESGNAADPVGANSLTCISVGSKR